MAAGADKTAGKRRSPLEKFSPAQRKLIAQTAINARWSRMTPEQKTEATAPGRAAFRRKFEDEIDELHPGLDEVIVMHPRRWGWFQSLLDKSDRPLFLPAANSPMNVAGVLTDVASQQVVGQMHGLPVVTDPNLPTDGGSGTNEDPIFVLRASDIVLWESGIRARVLPETKAQTLTVLLQIYSYLAFSAARFPQSVVEITGLTSPTF